MSLSSILTGAKPFVAAGLVVAGVVGTIATGGLLPVIAGGVGGAGLLTSSILDSSSKLRAQKIEQEQIDLNKTRVLASVSPENAALSTASGWDDFYLTLRKYSVPLLIATVVIVAGVILLKKK